MKFLTAEAYSVYKEISLLEILSEFTFVGGSALALYLHHRLSEDLDFFTWKETLPKETDGLIKTISASHKVEIANYTKESLDIIADGVKITFFANNWEILKDNRIKTENNIYVANLDLLCAMKVHTLSLRAKYRDYYDLYVLNIEKYNLQEMFDIAVKFIPGMTKKIFSMQISYIEDIDDENINHLEPKHIISLKEIQSHFTRELKKAYF
jgi:predicted nucleotidyltransferase component of viral defense system